MRSLSNRTGRAGFTLMELMVVLFIIGLAASVVAVSIARTHEKSVLRGEARRVQGTLRHARELSLMHRTPFSFVPHPKGMAFWIEKDGQPFGDALLLPEGLVIEGQEITFMPKGFSTGGTITITNGNKRGFHIAVDPVTGQAGIQRIQPS